MFAKIVNDLTMLFKLKGKKQSLEQVAAEMDPNTLTMETMKDDRVMNAVNILTGSAKCTCGVHRSDDEMEKEAAYANEAKEEGEEEGEGEEEEGEEEEGEEGEEEGEEEEGEGEEEEEGEGEEEEEGEEGEGEEGEGEEKEESSGIV